MLAHPTLDQLNALGLYGLAKGFRELEHKSEARGLEHAEWLGLLLEYELTLRRQKRFETRSRAARLRHAAAVEDVDYQSPRGLDRALFLKLGACDWIAERRNLLITGASGLGKSWLACALGQKACRQDLSVLYYRVPRTLRRPRDRAWRWALQPHAALHRPRQASDLGRLGAGSAQPRPGARSAGNHRRPLRRRLARHHQPGSRRPLARHDRQPDHRRRYPQPRHTQRLSDRTLR